MTARTSTGTGNWGTAGTWNPNGVPVAADDLTIQAGHNVTMNAAAGACNTLAINGTLTIATGLGALALTAQQDVNFNNGSRLTADLSGSVADSFTLKLNGVADGVNFYGLKFNRDPAGITLKGYQRTRWTTLAGAIVAGATGATVADATGWQVGDRIVFGSTQVFNATPRVDEVVLTSVAGNVLGWVGGITYDHASAGYVGNFSSNLTIQSANTAAPSIDGHNYAYCAHYHGSAAAAASVVVQDVLFAYIGAAFNYAAWESNTSFNNYSRAYSAFQRNAFYQVAGYGLMPRGQQDFPAQDIVFYSTRYTYWRADVSPSACASQKDWFRFIHFNAGSSAGGGTYHINVGNNGNSLRIWDSVYLSGPMGCLASDLTGIEHRNCKFLSSARVTTSAGNWIARGCDFGTTFGAKNCASGTDGLFDNRAWGSALLIDCQFQTSTNVMSQFANPANDTPDAMQVVIANKNGDPSIQETYTNASATVPSITLDNANGYSTPDGTTKALKFNTTTYVRDYVVRFQIPAPNNALAVLSGRIKRDAAQPVTVTLSGLGITASTYTCAGANGAWEQCVVQGTQASGADGMLDVEIRVSGGAAGTVLVDALSAPVAKAVNTGDMNFWTSGLPAGVVMGNSVSALDVWNVLKSQLTLAGSIGSLMVVLEKILRNKVVTDPVSGVMTVYDDDNTTVLLTAQLYEDAAATTTYRGRGAEQRRRLA